MLPEARIGVLAYVAGVIDSDGSIAILRDTHAIRHGRATQASFSERVTIRQIEPEAVDLVHSFFGGSRSVVEGRRAHQQPLQSVQIVDRQASRLLAEVCPYLRIKKQQALLCLALRAVKEQSRLARFAIGRGHRGGGRRPLEFSAEMERLFAEMKVLNRVDDRAARRAPTSSAA